MRVFKYILNFILVTSLIILLTSCGKDFLERYPDDQLTINEFYKNSEQLRQGTAGLYSVVWFQYNDKAAIGLGDALGGNIIGPWTTNLSMFYQFNITSLNPDLANAWKAFFRVIAQSNFVISNIKSYAENVTEEEKNLAIAEARFMRASAYFYLVRLWGPVMIIEDSKGLIDNPQLPLNPVEDVYAFIIRDLNYAIKHLKETDDAGRVTKWSAMGMLAKVYLTYSGYGSDDGKRNKAMLDSVKYYAGKVCKESGLELYNDYAGLFMVKNENSEESLFALQWVPLGTWGSQNTFQAYYAYEPSVTEAGDGWGGGNGPSYNLLVEFEKDTLDTIRRNATVFVQGNHYPELHKKDGGLTFTLTSPKIKKYIIGTKEDNDGQVASMNTSINTYILRLADVYLMYAEAILGNSSLTLDKEAVDYFNMVRSRAGVATKGYLTFDDIFHERRVELALEAQLWYDIIRWHYYQPEEALEFVNNQYRDYAFEWLRSPADSSHLVLGTPWSDIEPATHDDFILPYPEGDLIQNPLMQKPPVRYAFKDEE